MVHESSSDEEEEKNGVDNGFVIIEY